MKNDSMVSVRLPADLVKMIDDEVQRKQSEWDSKRPVGGMFNRSSDWLPVTFNRSDVIRDAVMSYFPDYKRW